MSEDHQTHVPSGIGCCCSALAIPALLALVAVLVIFL
jgi:hypothetical protein